MDKFCYLLNNNLHAAVIIHHILWISVEKKIPVYNGWFKSRTWISWVRGKKNSVLLFSFWRNLHVSLKLQTYISYNLYGLILTLVLISISSLSLMWQRCASCEKHDAEPTFVVLCSKLLSEKVTLNLLHFLSYLLCGFQTYRQFKWCKTIFVHFYWEEFTYVTLYSITFSYTG